MEYFPTPLCLKDIEKIISWKYHFSFYGSERRRREYSDWAFHRAFLRRPSDY